MAGIPSRIPKKPTGTESADAVNKSGAFAGGSMGSGSAKYTPTWESPKSERGRASYNVQAKKSGTFQGGPTGSGVVKDQWVGSGADKRYVQVPKANAGSGGPVPPSYNQTKRNAAAAGIDAGSSRNAPKRSTTKATPPNPPTGDGGRPSPGGDNTPAPTPPKDQDTPTRDTSSNSTSSSSSNDKPAKSAPAVPGSLNYFMKMTMGDGKKNARNRAYQMFKNYKKSGKLPSDMGSATQ